MTDNKTSCHYNKCGLCGYKNECYMYKQLADIKANCDLAIEGRDVKIKELELELIVEKDQHQEEINLHLHAEEYIKSLEKENAELKSEKGCETCTKFDEVNLTKAKEIIKGWLGDFYSPKAFYDKRAELIEQSEQFLEKVK